MLSWSANETQRAIDLAGIVDPDIDPGILGGRGLVAVGEASVKRTPDGGPVELVARELGQDAALKAAAVAGAFEILNRIVDATGLPVGKAARERLSDIIDTLGLEQLPHASH